jgi:hypothetical protein
MCDMVLSAWGEGNPAGVELPEEGPVKRIAIVTVGAVLLFAGSALASTRVFSGSIHGGGSTISFSTVFKHGKTKSIANVSFKHVPITCEDGGHTVSGSISTPHAVNNKRKVSFTKVYSSGTKAKLTATFNKKGTKASGTIHNFGDFGGTVGNCDTGTVNWHAHT